MGFALKKVEYLFSPDEYLEFERRAEIRHEYLDGDIYEMAGESDSHADICVNLITNLALQLRNKSCRVRAKETKVRSGVAKKNTYPPKGMFSYPDLVVICGKPEHHDQFKDVIINPRIIIEVLSDSTEKFDREIKFQRYQKYNETLTDYLLVSQDQPRIEHYIRAADGGWRYYAYENLETTFFIDSIDCEVKLRDVYDRIEFEEIVIDFFEDN